MKARHVPLTASMLLAAAWMTGCATDARREIEAQRVEAHASPLELKGAHGAPDAVIGTDGSVNIDGKPVGLDADQRTSTLAYRDAALDLIDLTLGDTADFTRFAIPRFLFGMVVHGGAEGSGRHMEKEAEKIDHSPQFCAALANMREKQDAMVPKVDQLRPYAHLTPDDIRDCRAGRPYTQPL